ncbi:diacylglycerol kinase [Chengkuizengella axinellae]|uniref:Diacylglycerol kinase n=1 Tax=Chengkuizengella axinellae TaxID=3064388 RepID=A0ABT9J655_9BACL|nr:diacylglycerol kinase [Chengkuizengella sp. 2205SS18-9]MDP5277103.1 diacylglycerol kinase [Chengkuizengella sp. 2205SS18-9]
MVKRARLIYNPSSGREEMKRRLPEVLKKLEKGGFETSTHETSGQGDAIRAAEEAVKREFDVVIAAGGDGTLNEVVNGLANQPYRPKLGILPLGTTNDFARALGIPKNWSRACDIILKEYTELIDIGKVNDEYFINIAGGGSLTELTYEVPSKLKTMLGQLAYYMKGLEKLPQFRPIHLSIKSKEITLEDEEVMIFLIANSNSVGGMEKIAPTASLSDGLFDVFILKKCNLAEFIRIVSLTLKGAHLNDPHVIHFKSNHLQISSSDYTQINLDGEYGGTLPKTFSLLPSHIPIFIDELRMTTYND